VGIAGPMLPLEAIWRNPDGFSFWSWLKSATAKNPDGFPFRATLDRLGLNLVRGLVGWLFSTPFNN
jgi:hypothetical protein